MLPRSISKSVFQTLIAAMVLSVAAFSFVGAALAYTSPGRPAGFVNDFAHVLSAETRAATERTLTALEQSTGVEVAVVTVPSLSGETIETYAVKLFQEWGIGSKQKDNGLLILVAPSERRARIEVGYGLEPVVTDLSAGRIVQGIMLPAFRKDDYDGGTSAAVEAVRGLVTGNGDTSIYSEPATGGSLAGYDWRGIIFAAVLFLNVIGGLLRRTKSWWLGGVIGAAIGTGVGFITGNVAAGIVASAVLAVIGLIIDYIVSKGGGPGAGPGADGRKGPRWPFIFFGGFRGGSDSGEGFGGFGGGRSGGGGSSGGW